MNEKAGCNSTNPSYDSVFRCGVEGVSVPCDYSGYGGCSDNRSPSTLLYYWGDSKGPEDYRIKIYGADCCVMFWIKVRRSVGVYLFFYFSAENACVKECIVKSAELINSLIRYFNIVCVFRDISCED